MDASRYMDGKQGQHETLGYLINLARNAVLAAIDHELSPLGVTAAQFIVVIGIACDLASTPSELCKLLGCDSGAMTRLLDRIEAKGIVRRARDAVDRRIVKIELTAKGRELHPQIMESVSRVHARIAQDLETHELDRLRGLLLKIIVNAGAKNFS